MPDGMHSANPQALGNFTVFGSVGRVYLTATLRPAKAAARHRERQLFGSAFRWRPYSLPQVLGDSITQWLVGAVN